MPGMALNSLQIPGQLIYDQVLMRHALNSELLLKQLLKQLFVSQG